MIRDAMRCPICRHRLEAQQTKEEIHVDPSGHGVYVCRNPRCQGIRGERVVYRRIMEEVEERREQVREAAQETVGAKLRDHYRLNERMNELTRWLRDRYPGYFRGQFKDQVDIAIYVMSKGKDDRSVGAGLAPDSRDGMGEGDDGTGGRE